VKRVVRVATRSVIGARGEVDVHSVSLGSRHKKKVDAKSDAMCVMREISKSLLATVPGVAVHADGIQDAIQRPGGARLLDVVQALRHEPGVVLLEPEVSARIGFRQRTSGWARQEARKKRTGRRSVGDGETEIPARERAIPARARPALYLRNASMIKGDRASAALSPTLLPVM
jgi:hypothetical protein